MVVLDQPAMPMANTDASHGTQIDQSFYTIIFALRVKVGVKKNRCEEALNSQRNECQQNVPMLFAQWAIAEMFKALVEWLSKRQQLDSWHCKSVAGCWTKKDNKNIRCGVPPILMLPSCIAPSAAPSGISSPLLHQHRIGWPCAICGLEKRLQDIADGTCRAGLGCFDATFVRQNHIGHHPKCLQGRPANFADHWRFSPDILAKQRNWQLFFCLILQMKRSLA